MKTACCSQEQMMTTKWRQKARRKLKHYIILNLILRLFIQTLTWSGQVAFCLLHNLPLTEACNTKHAHTSCTCYITSPLNLNCSQTENYAYCLIARLANCSMSPKVSVMCSSREKLNWSKKKKRRHCRPQWYRKGEI